MPSFVAPVLIGWRGASFAAHRPHRDLLREARVAERIAAEPGSARQDEAIERKAVRPRAAPALFCAAQGTDQYEHEPTALKDDFAKPLYRRERGGACRSHPTAYWPMER